MTLLVIYILLALSVSFICSLLEASLLTVTPATIQSAKQKGLHWASRMEALKNDIDRPLSAILTLNTIAHTMGAAGAGAEYARISGNTGEAVFAAALTLAILIFTEIIPKTIGARFATPLAPLSASMLTFMIKALSPIIHASKSLINLITPKNQHVDLNEIRDELLAIASIGEQSGSIRERESRFVHNLIKLNATTAFDIMTPRLVIFSLPVSTPLIDFAALIENKPFTRIPVYDKNPDDFCGFIIRSDALIAHLKDHDDSQTLASVMKPIAITPELTPLDTLFQRFISERHHIMLVSDEFGTTVGLVTMEDIIETIFGIEIVDESDQIADLQQHARNLWQERAQKMGLDLSQTES